MADVDGSIVLGLDIAQTTAQISKDLQTVLKGIGNKEVILKAKIENTDILRSVDQLGIVHK